MLTGPNRSSARRSHNAGKKKNGMRYQRWFLFRNYHHEKHEGHKGLKINKKVNHDNTKFKSTK
jgi:hypothetical protein